MTPLLKRLLIALAVGLLGAVTVKAVRFSKRTPASACPEILLQLDDATTEWAKDNKRPQLEPPSEAALSVYFKRGIVPRCPQGGQITYGTLVMATTCTMHGLAKDTRRAEKPLGDDLLDAFNSINPFARRYNRHPPSCIALIRQMDAAKQQWALENTKRPSDAPTAAEVAQYLKNNEIRPCPQHGKYVINAIDADPQCTKAPLGHTL